MRAVLIGLTGLAVCLIGGAAAGDKVKGSPEETFKAAAAAMEKDDAKTFLSHLTKDSQTAMAGGMVMMASYVKERGMSDKDEEKLKIVDALLSKHGIGADALARVKEATKSEDGKSMAKAMLMLGGFAKDKTAFIADALKNIPKLVGGDSNPLKDAALKEVRVDGERATGQMTSRKVGVEKTEPMFFKVEDGAWKIDIVRSIEEQKGSGKK